MDYTITPVHGGLRATIAIPMKDGRIFHARGVATFDEIRREMASHGGVGACHEQATLEGFFGSIGKFVKKLTKNKALRRAVKVVRKTIKHPAFITAVALIPGVGIPIAGGLTAAVAAEKMIRAATKGKKGSRKRVAARTMLKAARVVARKEARTAKRLRSLGLPKARPRRLPRGGDARAFRYLINLQPAAA